MVFKNLETKSKRNLAVSVVFALSILALHLEARGENIAGKEYTEAFVWTAPGGIGVNRGGVGDIDGDGSPELVLCYGSADTGGKVVILGISGSTLVETMPSISPPGAGQIRAFILNADGQGLPELVTTTSALWGAASLAIYRYDGTEMAKLWEHGGFNGSTYVDVGDTDNDGVPELITAEATYGRKFCVWEPNGDFTSWSNSFCDSAGIADCDFATVGDTDGDGQNEIFVNFRYWSPNEYRLYRYTGGTYQKVWSWQPPLGTAGGPTTGYMGDGAMGDFDGDGRQEMVMATGWYSPSHLKSYVFDWDGDSYEQVAVIDPDVSGTGYSNAWAGQLLGLDFDDVFSVTTSESQRTYFYAFEAGSYTLKGSLPGSLVAFGDLTKDGETELVVTVPDGQGGFKASVYSAGEPPCPPPSGPPWSFVHITDTHIGAKNARESLMAVVHDIKHLSSMPEFILVTGDISNVGCKFIVGCKSLNNYSLFRTIIGLLDIPYYPIPGNHDRKWGIGYEHPCPNGLSCYEAEIIGYRPTVNSFPHLSSVGNYWFEPAGKGYIFIGLDTGPDNESAADYLTVPQMDDLRELGNNNKCMPKIVFMHHPTAGGGDKTIIKNRDAFLDWCDQNVVKVVITGHTHQNVVCDRNGEEGWPIGETAYVQTSSCGIERTWGGFDDHPKSFRVFKVDGGIVSESDHIKIQDILNNRYEVEPNSPVEVHVYDSQGQHVGVDPSGGIKEGEIPGSYYLPQCSVETEDGSDDYPEKIIIFDPTDDYLCEVVGTKEGNYGLVITFVSGGEEITFTATDIPTSPGARHIYAVDWQALSAGEEGVILNIDKNGDGFFEQMVIADNELSYDEFALQTETVVDFDPDTLNLNSKGKFATVYIELPADFDVSEIDLFSLELNELVTPLPKPIEIGDYDSDGINDLMVKFDLQELIALLEAGEQIIDLTGRLWDGRPIAGFDFIRVIHESQG